MNELTVLPHTPAPCVRPRFARKLRQEKIYMVNI